MFYRSFGSFIHNQIPKVEKDYKSVSIILESESPENAIPILNSFIAMCPHCREAYVQLLYCYYSTSDWSSMERLLKKLLRNTARIVQNRNDES